MNERCPLNITPEILSDWRTNDTPSKEAQAIAAHVPTCLACQRIVAGYEQVAQILRTPPKMPSQGAVWHSVYTTISNKRRNSMLRFDKFFVVPGISTAAAILLLLITFFIAHINHPITPHPTPTVSPTTTPVVTSTPLPNVWQTVQSVNYGKGIAFSQNDPKTGYVCGNTANGQNSNENTILKIAVTHDGGLTWDAPIQTTVTGGTCILYVNPYKASDIVMSSYGCWYGCGGTGVKNILYRSLDSGKTWSRLALPSNDDTMAAMKPSWTRNALFVDVGSKSGIDTPPHLVAISVNNGPLAWTAKDPSIGQSNLTPGIYTLGDTINIYNDAKIATSSDDGATWSTFTPQGTTLYGVYAVPDNHTLISTSLINNSQYSRSTDGGRTWSPVLLGAGMSIYNPYDVVIGTPDGTIFGVQSSSSVQYKICKLPTGTTTWICDIPFTDPSNASSIQQFQAVSWDENGHPKLVWSASIHGLPINLSPVLEYHPA
jgi:hypothetical protein